MLTLTGSPNSRIFKNKELFGKYIAMKKLLELLPFAYDAAIEPTAKSQPHVHIIWEDKEELPLNVLKLFVKDTFFDKLCDPLRTAFKWESKTDYKHKNAIHHTYSPSIKLTENFSNEVDYLNKQNDKGYRESMIILYQQIKNYQCDSFNKPPYTKMNITKSQFEKIPNYTTIYRENPEEREIQQYLLKLVTHKYIPQTFKSLRDIVFQHRDNLVNRENPNIYATQNPRLKEVITL
jgi:hypothetical protein